MHPLTETVTTWQAVDGKIFSSRAECLTHEEGMSRVEYFTHAFPSMVPKQDQANRIKLYCYGYTTETSHREWQEAGFLREAGEIVHWETKERILEYVWANWNQALAYAITNEVFWKRKNDCFLREVRFKDLSNG